MTCPGCQAENHPRRRYCGKCGCNFEPACQTCGFGNERDDRFCGGCGLGLRADARGSAPNLAPNLAPVRVAVPTATSTWRLDELAELFARPPEVVDHGRHLPETGVAQDDLDRLFGDGP
jgi:hypothetical protein